MTVTELWRSRKYNTVRRVIIVTWCFFEMIFFSGVHYGWFQIIALLKKDGIFAEDCGSGDNNDTSSSSNLTSSCSAANNSKSECFSQEDSYRNVFYVASMTQTCCTILIGLMFDLFGVRVLKLTGICCFVSGSLIFAFVAAETSYLLYVAMPLLAVSSSLLIVSNYEVSNLFPKYRFAIVTFYTGAYDSATAVFMIINEASSKGGVSRAVCFCVLAACAFVAEIISTFAFLPKRKFADEQRKFDAEADKVRDVVSFEDEGARLTKFSDANSGVPVSKESDSQNADWKAKAIHTLDHFGLNMELLKFMGSRHFLLLVFWSTIQMMFMVDYFATIHPIINRSQPESKNQGFYSLLNGLILLGGMLSAPVSGIIIDKMRSSFRKGAQVPAQTLQQEERNKQSDAAEQEANALLANGDAETDATVRIDETSLNTTAAAADSTVANGNGVDKIPMKESNGVDKPPVTNGNSVMKVEDEKKDGHLAKLIAKMAYMNELFSLLPSLVATTVVSLVANGSLFVSSLLPLGFVFFTIFRSFMFGTTNSYLMIAFPPHHFGKLFGMLYLVVGLFTVVFQKLLDELFKKTDSYVPSCDPLEQGVGWNGYHSQLILLFVLTVVSFVHPIQIAISRFVVSRKLRNAQRTKPTSNGNGVAHA